MPRPYLLLGIAVLTGGSLMLCATAADPKKPSKPVPVEAKDSEPTPIPVAEEIPAVEGIVPDGEVANEDQGPWEITDKVELVYRETLKATGKDTISAKIQLKNITDLDLPGKLVLVIDGSSVDGTRLHEPQGQFTESTPYLQIIPAKRKLEAGDESPSKIVVLKCDVSPEKEELKEATLRWRAFTMTKPADLDNEPPADDKQVPGKAYTWGDMRRVMEIQSQATEQLVMDHQGAILGTATSEDENGNLIVRVYAARGGMSRKIPGTINGVPVELTVTGTIKGGPAFSRVTYEDGKAEIPLAPEADDASTDNPQTATSSASKTPVAGALAALQIGPPTRRFTRPVPIGVSSINQTLSVCAAGTLGCRCVGRDGRQYLLSNNHVFAEENAGTIGDPICQPSPGDVACAINPGDVIATLTAFQPISYFSSMAVFKTAPINLMDAAVAVSGAGMVDYCTPRGAYGAPARKPQENLYVGMPVQKQGRTSGFTKGKIYGLNIEIVVTYDPGLARFRSCIDVQTQSRSPGFGAPGDSGSLVVTIADRRPVGILFAGGGFNTYLNPISPVLNRFKVGVDDGTGSPPILGSGRMGNATGPVRQGRNVNPL